MRDRCKSVDPIHMVHHGCFGDQDHSGLHWANCGSLSLGRRYWTDTPEQNEVEQDRLIEQAREAVSRSTRLLLGSGKGRKAKVSDAVYDAHFAISVLCELRRKPDPPREPTHYSGPPPVMRREVSSE